MVIRYSCKFAETTSWGIESTKRLDDWGIGAVAIALGILTTALTLVAIALIVVTTALTFAAIACMFVTKVKALVTTASTLVAIALIVVTTARPL